MNTPLKVLSFLAGTALFAASTLSAATTDPVGYVSVKLESGYNPVGITFTKPAAYTGEIVNSTSSTVTISSAASLDTTNNSYYLEVIGDVDGQQSFMGERIDVSSISDATITLDLNAAHNTLASAAGFPTGLRVTIRPHYTISDFDDLIADEINTDNMFNAATSDLILLFDNGAFRTHLYYDGNWYENYGSNNVADSKILAPGSGFFFFRNPSAGTPSDIDVTFAGTVRMNNFLHKLNAGYQFVALGYPVDSSPTDLGFTDFFTASPNFVADESDLLLTWDGAFRTHLLYTDGNEKSWYQNFGGNEVVSNTNLLTASNAIIVLLRNSDETLEIVRPF